MGKPNNNKISAEERARRDAITEAFWRGKIGTSSGDIHLLSSNLKPIGLSISNLMGQHIFSGGSKKDNYYNYMEKLAKKKSKEWNIDENILLTLMLNDNTYNYKAFYDTDRLLALLMLTASPEAHFTDMGKTVYHPTFSNESMYSSKVSDYNPKGTIGGSWNEEGTTYTVSPSLILNKDFNYGITRDYLREEGVDIILPNKKANGGNLFPFGGDAPNAPMRLSKDLEEERPEMQEAVNKAYNFGTNWFELRAKLDKFKDLLTPELLELLSQRFKRPISIRGGILPAGGLYQGNLQGGSSAWIAPDEETPWDLNNRYKDVTSRTIHELFGHGASIPLTSRYLSQFKGSNILEKVAEITGGPIIAIEGSGDYEGSAVELYARLMEARLAMGADPNKTYTAKDIDYWFRKFGLPTGAKGVRLMNDVASNNKSFNLGNNKYIAANGGKLLRRYDDGGNIDSTIDFNDDLDAIDKAKLTWETFTAADRMNRLSWAESLNSNDSISKRGAVGMYQIMPSLLLDYNTRNKTKYTTEHLKDPKINRTIRNWYIDNLTSRPVVNKVKSNLLNLYLKTYAAYNWGPGNLGDYLLECKDKGMDIYNNTDWVDGLPKETRDYIKFIVLGEDTGAHRTNKAYNNRNKKEIGGNLFDDGGKLNTTNKEDIIDKIRYRLYKNIDPTMDYKYGVPAVPLALMGVNTKYFFPRETDMSNITGDPRYNDEIWATYLLIPEEKRHQPTTLIRLSLYKPIGSSLSLYALNLPSSAVDNLVTEATKLSKGLFVGSNVLGGYGMNNHSIATAIDPSRGLYVAYKDTYDLNPFKGDRAIAKVPYLSLVGDLSLGIGKPVNLYDRIYLDDYYGVDGKPTTGDYYEGYIPEVIIKANKRNEGGNLNASTSTPLKYDDLTLLLKAMIIRTGVANGLKNLDDIRNNYKELAEGGLLNLPSFRGSKLPLPAVRYANGGSIVKVL